MSRMQGTAMREMTNVVSCPSWCSTDHSRTVDQVHMTNPIDTQQIPGVDQDDKLSLFLSHYDGELDSLQISLGDYAFDLPQAETLLASLSALVTMMREVR